MKCTPASELSIPETRNEKGEQTTFHSILTTSLCRSFCLDFSQKSWYFGQGVEGSRAQPHRPTGVPALRGPLRSERGRSPQSAAPTEGLRRPGAKGFPTSLCHGPTISLQAPDTDIYLQKLHPALGRGKCCKDPRERQDRGLEGCQRADTDAQGQRLPSIPRLPVITKAPPLWGRSQLCRKEHTLLLTSPPLSLRQAAFHASNMAAPM